MRRKLNFSSGVATLIPDYWALTASTVEDILFFGKITIRQMIRSWRCHATDLASQIKDADTKLKFLQGKGATDIREIAKQYERPKFPRIGININSWGRDPEPLDAASIKRKYGATTFNVCGWCKYASGGTARYSYMITTSCGIKIAAGMRDQKRRFNTPCFLRRAPTLAFENICGGLVLQRERLVGQKRITDSKIGTLLFLESRAEKKPALPNHRPHDWFNVDNTVVCFVGEWSERIIPDQFVTARVIDGYRHHDGCVSVRYDKRIHSGPYIDGHGGGYGMARPEIMHTWEFEYLLEHPDFAGFWIFKGTEPNLQNFDPNNLLAAMAHEAILRSQQK